jgi:Spy/CpxP family protein refolding chaperone
MKTIQRSAAVLAMMGLLAGSAMAYGGGKGYGPGCPQTMGCGMNERGGMMRTLFELDLSDTQKEQIEKLMVEQRYAMKGQRGGMRDAALAGAISEKGFDRAAYLKSAAERAKTRAELRAGHLEKVVALLTKEQRTAFKAALEKLPESPMGCKRK